MRPAMQDGRGGLTHIGPDGAAVMVDVSEKQATQRIAVASGLISMDAATFAAIAGGNAAKGDVLGVARVAGIMASKKTHDLIPLCHPLPVEKISIDFELLHESSEVKATCVAKVTGRTGVEMEALTGVSVALLTIYDMCKAIDRGMEIGSIRLEEKRGGKSGVWLRAAEAAPSGGCGHKDGAPPSGADL